MTDSTAPQTVDPGGRCYVCGRPLPPRKPSTRGRLPTVCQRPAPCRDFETNLRRVEAGLYHLRFALGAEGDSAINEIRSRLFSASNSLNQAQREETR